MANNRGTKLINIPIQVHIGSNELNWRIVRNGDSALFVGSSSVGAMPHMPLGDGWDLVRKYLDVKCGDGQSVLKFLAAHGRFDPPAGSLTQKRMEIAQAAYAVSSGGHDASLSSAEDEVDEMELETITLQEFATIQDYVRRMLLTGNPTLPTPWRPREIQEYMIAFARSRSGSQAHVRVYHTYPSILAIVQFKLAQGAKFRTCYRKDCQLPFEITSRHTRRFCTQYCAHITSLRQRRKAQKKAENQKQS
jgi:hypothetical protein